MTPPNSADACVVQTTLPSAEAARAMAEALVDARLAACVQVLAVQSTYRWEGAICKEAEQLLTIKTRRSAWPALAAWMQANHPYAEPELLCLPVLAGAPGYLAWIQAQVVASAPGVAPPVG
jgi:periplasmic divalent cation tolerance protein